MIRSETEAPKQGRLLAIGGQPELPDFLRQRYPDMLVSTAATVLEGIDDLTRNNVRAVIAHVDSSEPQLADAVAGLREAAGENTKVLLCCKPEGEPRARKAVEAGADDYLLYPLDGAEVDEAIGYARLSELGLTGTDVPAVSMDELTVLADLLANLDADGFTVLAKLADLVRLAMGSEATTIVVEGSVADSGATVVSPVLVEPIRQDDQTIGQITVGHRSKPYGPGDLEKLRHYARLAAHLLAAADRQRSWRLEAMTDPVSGLYNRRYLLQFLDELLERARLERFRVTVLVFDIDNFKKYNDTHGHGAGDEIIRCIGKLFQASCREHDLVTRYGGDEFCVVFWDADQPRVTGSDHPSDALKILRRFREALKTHDGARLNGVAPSELTISGGLASFPWHASTTAELLERADQALLQAKRAGKNQVFVFDREPRDRIIQ